MKIHFSKFKVNIMKNNNEKNFVHCLITGNYDVAYKLLKEIAFVYDGMGEFDFCMEVQYVFNLLLKNNKRVDLGEAMLNLVTINQTKLD